jgi:hypothetical protein
MLIRRIVTQGAIFGFFSAVVFAQQTPASSPPTLREFPVILQQNVKTGKTPVGTKIQAKLAAATQFSGTIIPKNAVLSIVVTESVAKSAKDKARLEIRIDTATWDGGWSPLKAYLMPLYYPMTAQTRQSFPNGAAAPSAGDEADQRTNSQSPMQRQFPGNNTEAAQEATPDVPTISSRPVRMKNVELVPASDGGIALVSEHANVNLYKLTTYIFAADESAAH